MFIGRQIEGLTLIASERDEMFFKRAYTPHILYKQNTPEIYNLYTFLGSTRISKMQKKKKTIKRKFKMCQAPSNHNHAMHCIAQPGNTPPEHTQARLPIKKWRTILPNHFV